MKEPEPPSSGINRGRPRVGTAGGPSPTVKGSVTPTERELLQEVIAETGKNQSCLVREGVLLLLQRHGKLRPEDGNA